MNDRLQQQLAEVLSAIHRATSTGADFALAQLPDIAQQYIAYGRIEATLMSIISLTATALCAYATLRHGYLSDKVDELGIPSDGRVLSIVFGSVLFALLFMWLIFSLSHLLLVWLAPKVWLLKAIAALLA